MRQQTVSSIVFLNLKRKFNECKVFLQNQMILYEIIAKKLQNLTIKYYKLCLNIVKLK